MTLRLSEAQQLNDALGDPLLRPALEEFIRQRRIELNGLLFIEAKKPEHSAKQVAYLAGRIEECETVLAELERFAQESMRVLVAG